MANQIPGWIIPLGAGFILGAIVFTPSGRGLASAAAKAGARKAALGAGKLTARIGGI